jgi:O-methyltransferase
VLPMNAHSPSLSRLVFLAARLAMARARGKLNGEEPQPAPLAEGTRDETPSVPQDETPSVPQDEALPVPQAETPSVPQDETPPDAPVETPSAPSVDVETAPPQSDFAAYARFASPLRANPYADFDDAEREIYLKAHLNLCGSVEAIVSLIRAVRYIVENKIPGALIECGVFMGGNIEVMIRTLQTLGVAERDIFLYDTFAGMPRPDATDDFGLDDELKRIWDVHRTDADGDAGCDWMRAGIDVVRRRIEPLGYPPERLHFVKGVVEDTIPTVMPPEIALLRLDTDFYSSTKHELVHLYPRLPSGGVLIIDDYGANCRRAVDEYAAEHQLRWFLTRLDAHVRLLVKP